MAKMYSFRLKITIALIIVIVSISFASFYLYDKFLTERIYKTTESSIIDILHFLKDQYYNAEHGTDSPVHLLKDISEHKWVLNTYLADSVGKLIYISDSSKLDLNKEPLKQLSSLNKEISIEEFKNKKIPFTRVYLKMQNYKRCYACHDPATKTLGYTIYDISMLEVEKNKSFTLKSSIFFTLLLILIIVGLITAMHYRFVKKSLSHFQSKIAKINEGNLDERVNIPEDDELGLLGKSFNKMLDNFQNTQKQLMVCHKRELLNNKKLATVGEMAARLAHEIRNPITGIANAIEIIVDEIQDDQNKPILEEIQRQANRVNSAVSNLLIYSHTKELNEHEGNINVLVKSLLLFLKSQDHNKNIQFHLNLQPKIPVFKFDHEKIENALLNLGLNAIQAIQDKGTVTYTTKYNSEKRMVIITVGDTGTGIPDEILPKIFSPFFTTRTEGTGLGLAIVKDIVEKHQGEISVENKADGGCVFYIYLPID